MTEDYPKFLPLPKQSNYSRNRSSGVISSNVQSGPLLTQRTSFDNPSIYTLEWTVSRYQAILLDLWFREGLDEGMKPFNMKLLNESGVQVQADVKFLPDSAPQLTRVDSDVYTYSASVFVRKVVQPYDGQFELIKELSEISPNGDFIKGTNLLNIIVNQILPEV